MTDHIDIAIQRKAVRHIYLRVHPDGTVTMTVPFAATEETIRKFAESRKLWIQRALARLPQQKDYQYADGEIHRLFGQDITLRVLPGKKNSCAITRGTAVMTVSRAQTDRKALLAAAWKEQLASVLEQYIQRWSTVMDVEPAGFSIRHVRSRWGSCKVKTGELTFALNLAGMDKSCIEYVVVHELNHLLEASHSPRFHRLMDHWLPDWRERKQKLNRSPWEFS